MNTVLVLLALLLAVFNVGASPHVEVLRRDKNLPARLPYVFPPPGASIIADRIRSRRTNQTLLALDGILINDRSLNAAAMADGEDVLFGNIRDSNSLPATMRELMILRTATLNSATYQWLQHFLVGFSAGLTTPQLEDIRDPARNALTARALTPPLRAALAYTDEMTRFIRVSQLTFNNLRTFLDDQQVVEATMTIAGYNLISRFVVALDVDGMANAPLPSVNASFTMTD
ncbi:hypothetical protein AURDEDRAFT_118894 [Auricularia subglabra TFB-10046 SS5]|nr:hypothetical protein AURDEDRAFT_118894 [Auricularia subglabra TFB-10046 SS5]